MITPNYARLEVPVMLAQLPQADPAFRKAAQIRSFRSDQLIAKPEDLGNHLYILMNGRARLVRRNNEGRRLILATLSSGAIFGEGTLLGGADPDTFAEAEQASTVWVLPAAPARELAQRHPVLGWGLLQTVGKRLTQVENHLEDVAYKRLPERLAGLLLELVDNKQGMITGTSHQSLADNLGTYRETVSAILRGFKKGGLVELGYRRIRILNADGLRRQAGLI
jgi:CRP/FNR family transcriptional regulator, cyclic AMP receptor protein